MSERQGDSKLEEDDWLFAIRLHSCMIILPTADMHLLRNTSRFRALIAGKVLLYSINNSSWSRHQLVLTYTIRSRDQRRYKPNVVGSNRHKN